MTYPVISSEVVFDGKLSRMRIDELRMPGGDTAKREVCEHLDAVAVVPITDDGDVVLVRQYRHPVRDYQLEIPAGMLDMDGEAPEDAARRELAEEVQLAADTLTELVRFRNSSGWTDETTIVYRADGVEPRAEPEGFQAVHEEADMEVVRLPLHDAVGMARSGQLLDAKTIIGLLLVGDRGD